MELSPLILKWVTFLLRWGHVFFAITWIGNSFLFNYLDNKLKKNLENNYFLFTIRVDEITSITSANSPVAIPCPSSVFAL